MARTRGQAGARPPDDFPELAEPPGKNVRCVVSVERVVERGLYGDGRYNLNQLCQFFVTGSINDSQTALLFTDTATA